MWRRSQCFFRWVISRGKEGHRMKIVRDDQYMRVSFCTHCGISTLVDHR